MGRYFVYFIHRHNEFRMHEFNSVLKLYGISESCYDRKDVDINRPFLEVTLENDDVAQKISQRCILIKGIYEYIASGPNYAQLGENLLQCVKLGRLVEYCDPSVSWCLNIDAFGKSYKLPEKEQKRNFILDLVPLQGLVKIKNPHQMFWLIEEIGCLSSEDTKNAVPILVYFGREIAGSGRHCLNSTGRDLIDKQKLKKRRFIGPTSMDHELSLIMANFALASPTKLIIDPFVGTGSILIACTTFGSMCIGADIDEKIIHRDGKVDMMSNFRQYDLPKPDIVLSDISHSSFGIKEQFDGIVCDPPYGIRAGSRKCSTSIGENKSSANPISKKQKLDVYCIDNIYLDLLVFSAKRLVLHGRLVYILPVMNREGLPNLPTHPCLKIISVCKQVITRKLARIFVTMEKIGYCLNCPNYDKAAFESDKKFNIGWDL